MSDLPIYTESIHTNARNALRNTSLRSALSKMAGHYGESLRTIQADSMWETYRERAREIKREAINHLDLYLERFTAKVEENGGQVHWARDADEANRIVVEIARRAGIRIFVPTSRKLGCSMVPRLIRISVLGLVLKRRAIFERVSPRRIL